MRRELDLRRHALGERFRQRLEILLDLLFQPGALVRLWKSTQGTVFFLTQFTLERVDDWTSLLTLRTSHDSYLQLIKDYCLTQE